MPWSFRGTSFERVLSGDSDPRWFPQSIAVSVDVVAGDVGASPRRFVDIGAREFEQLQLSAAVLTTAARDALVGGLGKSGDLIRPGGQSAKALLVKADPLASQGAYKRLNLTFEFIQ